MNRILKAISENRKWFIATVFASYILTPLFFFIFPTDNNFLTPKFIFLFVTLVTICTIPMLLLFDLLKSKKVGLQYKIFNLILGYLILWQAPSRIAVGLSVVIIYAYYNS